MRTVFAVLAACLLGSGAYAQYTNPDNPHDTKSKDRQTANTPQSVTNPQVEATEPGNPTHTHATELGPARTPAAVTNPKVEAGERNNAEQPQYKDRDQWAMDREMMIKATPQMQLQKLHLTNLKEIDAGRMAEQNGTAKIKDYARMLQRDHQDADQKVMDLAKSKGWTLSDQPMKPEMQQKNQMEKDRLSSLKGADFDKTFANMMVMGHKHVIEMAQAWKQNCKDKDVCALIDSLMPKLQQHLSMAEQIRGPMPQGRAPETR